MVISSYEDLFWYNRDYRINEDGTYERDGVGDPSGYNNISLIFYSQDYENKGSDYVLTTEKLDAVQIAPTAPKTGDNSSVHYGLWLHLWFRLCCMWFKK